MGDCCDKLQSFYLERRGFEGDFADEYESPCFGGSSPMKNLQKLVFIGVWNNLNSTLFSESIQKFIPNLQELEFETQAESITEILVGILENCRNLTTLKVSSEIKVLLPVVLKTASQNTSLTHLQIEGYLRGKKEKENPFSWKDIQWPTIRTLIIPLSFTIESLTEMESACPNLEVITFNEKSNDKMKDAANQYLSDRSHWKNLKKFNFRSYDITDARPEMKEEKTLNMRKYEKKYSDKKKEVPYNDFVSLWLKHDFPPWY